MSVVVSNANWWCSTCGARGGGNGAAYSAWLRGHTCGSQWEPTPSVWPHSAPESSHQTTPGRVTMTFTTMTRGAA